MMSSYAVRDSLSRHACVSQTNARVAVVLVRACARLWVLAAACARDRVCGRNCTRACACECCAFLPLRYLVNEVLSERFTHVGSVLVLPIRSFSLASAGYVPTLTRSPIQAHWHSHTDSPTLTRNRASLIDQLQTCDRKRSATGSPHEHHASIPSLPNSLGVLFRSKG
jgi:hypothetical protein